MIKTLARSIREFKKPAIQTPLLVTVEVILECIIPFIIANLINQMQAGCEMSVIVNYGIVLVVMAVLSLIFGVAAGNTCATASTGFARNLRQDMFYHIQDYSFENIDKFSVSSLVTRMTTDVVNVQMSFMMIIRVAIRGPLMLIFSFVMGFVMGGRLAMIFLVTIPLLGIGLALVIRAAMPIFRRVFRKYDALNDSVQENVQAMRVVKSYVREDYEKKKFAAAAEDVCRDFTKAERIMALNSPMMQICVYAGMAFVLSFGSYLVISSQGTEVAVGQMSAILTYSFQILMSLMSLSMVFVMIAMSMESAERIVEVLSEQSNLTSPENAITEVKDGSIDFDNVNFKYSKKAERNALSDVDLHIKSGEVIGILGGTGSSKSTLVQLIPRLYDVTGGKVLLDGVDVRDLPLSELRRRIGYIPQQGMLFTGTVESNLKFAGDSVTDDDMRRAATTAQATDFIEERDGGFESEISQGGGNVSGGQRQRLSIARALAKRPEVIVFDDSFSALDYKTDALLREALARDEKDSSLVVVAQRIATIMHADQIIVLDEGHVVGQGTHEELLRSCPAYLEIAQSQLSAKELGLSQEEIDAVMSGADQKGGAR